MSKGSNTFEDSDGVHDVHFAKTTDSGIDSVHCLMSRDENSDDGDMMLSKNKTCMNGLDNESFMQGVVRRPAWVPGDKEDLYVAVYSADYKSALSKQFCPRTLKHTRDVSLYQEIPSELKKDMSKVDRGLLDELIAE